MLCIVILQPIMFYTALWTVQTKATDIRTCKIRLEWSHSEKASKKWPENVCPTKWQV